MNFSIESVYELITWAQGAKQKASKAITVIEYLINRGYSAEIERRRRIENAIHGKMTKASPTTKNAM